MTAVNTEPLLYAGDMTPHMGSDPWARKSIRLKYERRKETIHEKGRDVEHN